MTQHRRPPHDRPEPRRSPAELPVRDGRSVAAEGDQRPAVGTIVEVDVAELTHTGEAIGRVGGYVLFLRNAIPGERHRVRVTQSKRRYGRADTLQRVRTSPGRVQPACRHFGFCGRCSLQHLSRPEQWRVKEQLLRLRLEHALPGRSFPIHPTLGGPDEWGTRNKAHFVLGHQHGQAVLGHFAAHTRELIPISECPVHLPTANAIAFHILEVLRRLRIPIFDETTGQGGVRHLLLRTSRSTGETLALIVATSPAECRADQLALSIKLHEHGLVGLHLNLNPLPGPVVLGSEFHRLAGQDQILERIAGIDYQISPTAFFQTNAQGAELLVEQVLHAVPTEAKRVLDLYCGAGLFSLPLARRGQQMVGIEQNPQAIADARANAERNRITGCDFQAGKTEKVLKRLPTKPRFDAVVFDPPRAGAPEWILRMIAHRLRPATIVDVSCDAESLARDVQLLDALGYRLHRIQPVDMFPQTAQVEAVATFRRG